MDGAIEGRRRRRTHSAQFKARVAQACRQPGVSIAAVALSHGLNANLVRRWMNGCDTGCAGTVALKARPPAAQRAPTDGAGGFVPVQLETPSPAAPDIRLELRRGASSVLVNWPAQDAAACGTWLREWLR